MTQGQSSDSSTLRTSFGRLGLLRPPDVQLRHGSCTSSFRKAPSSMRWGVSSGAINEINVQTQYLPDRTLRLDGCRSGAGDPWLSDSESHAGRLRLGLLGRGASGWCPVTAMTHNGRRAREATRSAISRGEQGVLVEDAITIYRPVDEVYSYWRNLENLPQFMEHLDDVRDARSACARGGSPIGPLGVRVGVGCRDHQRHPADADLVEIGRRRPTSSAPARCASSRWASMRPSCTCGSSTIRRRARLGATVAWLLGEDPQHQIAEDLRRFKQLIETGEVSAVQDYQPAPSTPARPRARRSRRRFRLGTVTEKWGREGCSAVPSGKTPLDPPYFTERPAVPSRTRAPRWQE